MLLAYKTQLFSLQGDFQQCHLSLVLAKCVSRLHHNIYHSYNSTYFPENTKYYGNILWDKKFSKYNISLPILIATLRNIQYFWTPETKHA